MNPPALPDALHVHRYVVDSPHDGVKMLDATCACGATRQFPASGEDRVWVAHIPNMGRSKTVRGFY